MTRIVLTRPQGLLGVPGAAIPSVIIPSINDAPANVVVLDTTENQTIKWLYTLTDTLANTAITAEVLAIRRSSSNISFNQYGVVGDRLRHTVDVIVSGSALSFEVTNLHSSSLLGSVLRIEAA